MKGLILALGLGAIYCAVESALYEALYGFPLEGDTRLAFFFVGFGFGAFTAHKLSLLW